MNTFMTFTGPAKSQVLEGARAARERGKKGHRQLVSLPARECSCFGQSLFVLPLLTAIDVKFSAAKCTMPLSQTQWLYLLVWWAFTGVTLACSRPTSWLPRILFAYYFVVELPLRFVKLGCVGCPLALVCPFGCPACGSGSGASATAESAPKNEAEKDS